MKFLGAQSLCELDSRPRHQILLGFSWFFAPADSAIKMPAEMKKALEEVVEKEFSRVSDILKKTVKKYLQEHGIGWRKESEKKPKK